MSNMTHDDQATEDWIQRNQYEWSTTYTTSGVMTNDSLSDYEWNGP